MATMTSDHRGETLSGKTIPPGTTVRYRGHLPSGNVFVELPDGTIETMNPLCFPCLRTEEEEIMNDINGHENDPAQHSS